MVKINLIGRRARLRHRPFPWQYLVPVHAWDCYAPECDGACLSVINAIRIVS